MLIDAHFDNKDAHIDTPVNAGNRSSLIHICDSKAGFKSETEFKCHAVVVALMALSRIALVSIAPVPYSLVHCNRHQPTLLQRLSWFAYDTMSTCSAQRVLKFMTC